MESATSASLLVRLRDVGNEDAWDDFYRLYSPLILSFACRRGCTPDDAADVLQETMVRLLRTFPGFSYEPALGSFRSFLLKVVDARIKDAFRRKAPGREQTHYFRSALACKGEQKVLGGDVLILHALRRVGRVGQSLHL